MIPSEWNVLYAIYMLFWHWIGIFTFHKETAVDSFLRQAVTIYHKMSFTESLLLLLFTKWYEILRSKINGKCIYSIRLTKLCRNLFWSKVERRCNDLSYLLRKGTRITFRLLLWGLIAPRKFSHTSCCSNMGHWIPRGHWSQRGRILSLLLSLCYYDSLFYSYMLIQHSSVSCIFLGWKSQHLLKLVRLPLTMKYESWYLV